ncbi:GrpB family protein [Paenibacillus sp. FSL R5-0810]|uniref:GrpB family protein n=1 Tax=Paenibacillus sp. FSL R5-0810 TaxID=2921659 RepID=UPI0030FB1A41
MSDSIIVVPYNPSWKEEFKSIGLEIRQALGELAIRVDHIGSTSIEGHRCRALRSLMSARGREHRDVMRHYR